MHLNVPLREPLVPMDQASARAAGTGGRRALGPVAGGATTGDGRLERCHAPREDPRGGRRPARARSRRGRHRWAIDSGWPVVAEPFSSAPEPCRTARCCWPPRTGWSATSRPGHHRRPGHAGPPGGAAAAPPERARRGRHRRPGLGRPLPRHQRRPRGVLRAPVPTAGAGEWRRRGSRPAGRSPRPWPTRPTRGPAGWRSPRPSDLRWHPAPCSSWVVQRRPRLDLATHPAGDRPAVVASRGLAGIDGCAPRRSDWRRGRWAEPRAARRPHFPRRQRPAHRTGRAPLDLTIVAANDDGGGIFTSSSQGSRPGSGLRARVRHPTGTDLAALCAAHGGAPPGRRHEGRPRRGRRRATPRSGVVEVRLDRSATARPTPGCGPPPRPPAPAADCLGRLGPRGRGSGLEHDRRDGLPVRGQRSRQGCDRARGSALDHSLRRLGGDGAARHTPSRGPAPAAAGQPRRRCARTSPAVPGILHTAGARPSFRGRPGRARPARCRRRRHTRAAREPRPPPPAAAG